LEDSPVTARQARDDALAQVDEAANEAWKAFADAAILRIATSQPRLTSEDVWSELDAIDWIATHDPRALGARLQCAALRGIIERTDATVQGARKSAHGRPVRVWNSMVYNAQEAT